MAGTHTTTSVQVPSTEDGVSRRQRPEAHSPERVQVAPIGTEQPIVNEMIIEKRTTATPLPMRTVSQKPRTFVERPLEPTPRPLVSPPEGYRTGRGELGS